MEGKALGKKKNNIKKLNDGFVHTTSWYLRKKNNKFHVQEDKENNTGY
jgi:hypothetical protein